MTKAKQMKPNDRLTTALAIVAVTIGGAFAETSVNCDDVMKHLKAGASPRDLADTTPISMDKIEECQNKADVESAESMHEREEYDEGRHPFWRDKSEKTE